MKVLVVHQYVPMPDRASGELRLFTILKLLAVQHEVYLVPYRIEQQIREFGESELARYKALITEIGVTVTPGWVRNTLRLRQFDVVLFEFYHTANNFFDDVRAWQPNARVIVDSVDVHFRRLEAKAGLTKNSDNFAKARIVKQREMTSYANADLVVAVTEDDRAILLEEDGSLPIHVLPNVHSIPAPLKRDEQVPFSMVFVGTFRHEPNTDAVKYFCSEIMPRIIEQFPKAHLSVIGESPPEEVMAYASEHVEILGYVPETEPFLRKSAVSVAPLRFGAGMKGKIGEAMSLGLPVVTTPVGAEGFGAKPGTHFLVANNADEFVELIGKLFSDEALYEAISKKSRKFIKVNYSPEAVSQCLRIMMDRVMATSPKRLSWLKRVWIVFLSQLKDHVLWRFR